MMTITKIEGIDELTRKLRGLPHVVEKATVSALNKIGTQGTTQAKKKVTGTYRLRTKDLKGYLKLRRARRGSAGSRLFAVISGTGKPFPLVKFDSRSSTAMQKQGNVPSQKGIPVAKRKPVHVKVKKQGGRKKVQHAFFARMPSGHVGIFKRDPSGGRTARGSAAIRQLYTTGIAKMFEKEGIPAIETIIRTKGREIVQHELDYYLLKEAKMAPARGKK